MKSFQVGLLIHHTALFLKEKNIVESVDSTLRAEIQKGEKISMNTFFKERKIQKSFENRAIITF